MIRLDRVFKILIIASVSLTACAIVLNLFTAELNAKEDSLRAIVQSERGDIDTIAVSVNSNASARGLTSIIYDFEKNIQLLYTQVHTDPAALMNINNIRLKDNQLKEGINKNSPLIITRAVYGIHKELDKLRENQEVKINVDVRYLYRSIIVVLVLIIILLAALVFYIYKMFIVPVNSIVPVLESVESGNLLKKVDIPDKGPLAVFKITINKMIDSLALHHLQQKTAIDDQGKDIKRKEFYINNMHNAFSVLDTENRIVDINPAFTEMLGYTRQEIIGRSVFDLFDEDNKKIIVQEFEKREKGQASTYELNIHVKDGSSLPIITSGAPLIEDGKLVGKVGIYTDVSYLKSLQAELELKNRELEKSNKAKSDFLASMSHELRTPLNAIIGFSEVLLERNFGTINQKQEEYLRDILEAGEHLLLLINDILDLARVESGQMTFEPVDFYVRDIVEQSVSMIKERALKHRINLTYEVQSDIAVIYADERKIKQVLYNLLTNAIKFTPDNGSIKIVVNKSDGTIMFSVEDSGVGIPEEAMSRLFYPFSQIRQLHPSIHEGTGLGLSIVKAIVELHGGGVWVESRVGKGSRFVFTIPDHIKHSIGLTYSRERDKKIDGNKILIVEDNTAIIKLLKSYLQDAGYIVEVAGDGEQALSEAVRFKPDIITLNLSIPKKNGWLVLKSLQESQETRDIPVIIISSFEEGREALKLGASAFILKPVDRQTLLREIYKISNWRRR